MRYPFVWRSTCLCRIVPLAAINGEISPPEFLLFTDGLSLWEFRSGNSHIFSAFLFYSAGLFPCVFHDYFKLSLNNCCLCHCLSVLVPPVSSTDFSCYRPCGDLRSLLPEVTCLPLPVCVCTQTSGVVVAERSQLAAACSGVCEGVPVGSLG